MYGQLEYYKNLIFLFPNILFGAYGGYVFVKYTTKKDHFDALLIIGSIITAIVTIAICVIQQNFYLAVPLISINLFVIIEQKLKVNKKYIRAFLFKPLLAIFTLVLGLLIFLNISPIEYDVHTYIFCTFSMTIITWLFLVRKYLIEINYDLSLLRNYFITFVSLIKSFGTGSLAGFVLLLWFFFERHIIRTYFSDNLAEYSFSFNLTQILVIVLSVFSYLSTVEYGEKFNELTKQEVTSTFRKYFLVYVIFLLVYLFSIKLVSNFYNDFSNLYQIVSILCFSKGIYFFIGIFNPILIYKGFNNKILFSITTFFLINVFLVYLSIFNEMNLFFILILNASLIFLYSLFLLYNLIYKVNYVLSNNSNS